MTLADDMRKPSESNSSLLGLAVMLQPVTMLGEVGFKCSLVDLDTKIHKTEQIIEKDPILVSFDG